MEGSLRVEEDLLASLQAKGGVYLLFVGGQISLSQETPALPSLQQIMQAKEAWTFFEKGQALQSLMRLLQNSHDAGLLHRHLQPEHLYLQKDGTALLGGWEHSDTSDAASNPPFTPYSSPEALRKSPLDARSDLFSLGAVFYQWLTGRRPFEGESPLVLLRSILAGTLVPPHVLHPRCPEALSSLCIKLLSPLAEERPGSARLAAEELEQALLSLEEGQPQEASPADTQQEPNQNTTLKPPSPNNDKLLELVKPQLRPKEPPEDTKRKEPPSEPPATSTRWYLWFGAGALLAALLTVSLLPWREAPPPPKSRLEELKKQQKMAQEHEAEVLARYDEALLAQARLTVEHSPRRALELLAGLSPSFTRLSAARMIAADALARGVPTILAGPPSMVDEIVFSPDGKLLASGSNDQLVRLWEAQSGRLLHTFQGHTQILSDLRFSPDGETLASADNGGMLWLWSVKAATEGRTEGRELRGHKSFINTVLFSPDGKSLFSCGGEKAIYLWDVKTGESKSLQTSSDWVVGMALSPDGQTLASTNGDGKLLLWDISTGTSRLLDENAFWTPTFSAQGDRLSVAGLDNSVHILDLKSNALTVLQGHHDMIVAVDFSPDGRRLASMSRDKTVRIWDASTGECQRILPDALSQFSSQSLKFSPDGRMLAFTSIGGTTHIWEEESGDIRAVHGHLGIVVSLCFSPDGVLLASAGQDGSIQLDDLSIRPDRVVSTDGVGVVAFSSRGLVASSLQSGELELFDTESTRKQSLHGLTQPSRALAFSSDGTLLASTGAEDSVSLWDLATRQNQSLPCRVESFSPLVFSPGRSLLAYACDDKNIWLWEPSFAPRSLQGHEGKITSLAFSPDGNLLASGSYDNTVRLWNLSTGESQILREHTSSLRLLRFSPDGKLLACGGAASEVSLWKVQENKASFDRFLPGHSEVSDLTFSPDSQTLAADSSSGALFLWDVATGEKRVLIGHEGPINKLSFSPGGAVLASASWDGTVRLWDVFDWRASPNIESRALWGHRGKVTDLSFSPDGKSITSASEDGTVRIWRDDLPFEREALFSWLSEFVAAAPSSQ